VPVTAGQNANAAAAATPESDAPAEAKEGGEKQPEAPGAAPAPDGAQPAEKQPGEKQQGEKQPAAAGAAAVPDAKSPPAPADAKQADASAAAASVPAAAAAASPPTQPPRPVASPPPAAPPRRQAAPPAGSRVGAAPSVPGSDARFASRPGVTSRHSPQETAILPPRPSEGSRLGGRYLAIALAGLLVLGGAAVYGVTQLTGKDSANGNGNGQAATRGTANGNGSGSSKQKQGGAVKPGSVTVAVLNGTTVPGLAATLSDQIAAAGFKVGTITNFSDQQLAESVIQYAPGHQAEARAVSRRLGIAQREQVNPSSQALAGDATVIVIAGSDKSP
jgi:hypothetical protein